VASTADPEAALDRLVEAGAVREHPDGSLETTDEFEDVRRIYHDTYGDADRDLFRSTIAELFGVDQSTAAEQITENEVTREQLVAFLAAQSFLDDPPDRTTLGVMASLLVEIGPGSPVPGAVEELSDEAVRAAVADHESLVVTVWRPYCEPCEAMKADIDDVLRAVPDGVSVVGIDGASCPAFVREYDVEAAPTILGFRNGAVVERLRGRHAPDAVADRLQSVYDADA
jgi:thiol-disulfide isomerase/thioredoxin